MGGANNKTAVGTGN